MESYKITDEIKDRLDIVDFISEYVPLKKSGSNFKGLCPFHQEKSPSFMVNPTKKIFHCFGCHKGGDVFNFLMYYENITFQEAINKLSQLVGIKIDNQKNVAKGREELFQIYNVCLNLFNEQLQKNNKAMSYLQNRGINNEVIKTYKVGYSLSGTDFLYRHLKEMGFKEDDIFRSRLVHKDGEKKWDFFRDRIMFPIYDKDGHVIAFGGRTLSESKNSPKYINSPDTDIFKKGSSLFGLYQAKNAIISKGYAILVEGYMDVIMCFQHGFENVIAPLGTALTEQQLERIKKYTNNLLLIFDGDTAGISATKRAIDLTMSKSFNTKIVLLPKDDDPDSILKREGYNGLKRLFSKAMSPVSFYFRLFSKNNKTECVRNLISIVLTNNDILQREEYLKQITEISGINELAIRQEADRILKKITKRMIKNEQTNTDTSVGNNAIEEYVLQMVIDAPPSIRQAVYNIDIENLQKCTTLRLLDKIKKHSDLEGSELFDRLLSESDDEERSLLTKLGFKTKHKQEISEMSLNECLKNMLLKIVENQMKEATLKGNLAVTNMLLEQKRRLSSQKEEGD